MSEVQLGETVDEELGEDGNRQQGGVLGRPLGLRDAVHRHDHRNTAAFGVNDADVRPKRVEGASLVNLAVCWQWAARRASSHVVVRRSTRGLLKLNAGTRLTTGPDRYN